MPNESITLSQFNKRLTQTVNAEPSLHNVWVTAETSDVRISGGHCYLELVEKDETGKQLAKMRATIWSSLYVRLSADFRRDTGCNFTSNIKVMVLVSANFHPVFGLSVSISSIDPSYTMGDLLRRRNEMILRLQKEGVIDNNRQLPLPMVPQRVAVISAQGAAGYGDFVDQLLHNRSRIRFAVELFQCRMQGEGTASSIIAALDTIAERQEDFDVVVIIRGGGATTDLQAFENYDLANNIAQFPLPVIIGIGHERDITLLDYVAKMRVKTPTAAAEWLVSCGENLLGWLQSTAAAMLQAVTDRVSGCHQQLSFFSGKLPAATKNAIFKAQKRLINARIVLAGVADRRLHPLLGKLDQREVALRQALNFALARARQSLDATEKLVDALSPQATLKRGYSITCVGGKAVKSVEDLTPGEVAETFMADGAFISNVVTISKNSH